MMALKCRVSNELPQLNFPMDSYTELIPLINRLPKVSALAASGTSSPLSKSWSLTAKCQTLAASSVAGCCVFYDTLVLLAGGGGGSAAPAQQDGSPPQGTQGPHQVQVSVQPGRAHHPFWHHQAGPPNPWIICILLPAAIPLMATGKR